MLLRLLPLFPAVLLLAGCRLSPLGLPKMALPADWKNAGGFPVTSAQKDLSRWWGRFDDPTLSRLITMALQDSPDIALAEARIRESRARRDISAAALAPDLGYSASGGRSGARRDGVSEGWQSSYSAGLDASWEIDLFGRRSSDLAAATAQLGATEENYHSVQAALVSEIAIAYTNLRAFEGRLIVVRRSVKSREETYQIADWRYKAGETDALEPNQALGSLEQARAQISSLEQSLGQTRNLLCVLTGREPGALDGLLASGKKAVPNPARSLALGIPADTLRQRPDVRVAGYQLLAAAANTRSAQADQYPTLNLSGSLGMNALSSSKIFDPNTFSAGVIAGLGGPIFDAGRIRAGIEAQSAIEEQALQTYRSILLTALSETEDALIACRRSAERLETLERATAAAREADTLAQQRYEAGVIDLLNVLDAQRTLLGLEESLLTVRADRAAAYIQLYKALGGGWSPRS